MRYDINAKGLLKITIFRSWKMKLLVIKMYPSDQGFELLIL